MHKDHAKVVQLPKRRGVAQTDATTESNRVAFEADEHIVLHGVKATITLTNAGKILIDGEYIRSRSTRRKRIEDGSISLS